MNIFWRIFLLTEKQTTPSKIVIFETVQEKVIGKNNATAVTIITINDIFFCTNLFIELNLITPKKFFRYFITKIKKSPTKFFIGDLINLPSFCKISKLPQPLW